MAEIKNNFVQGKMNTDLDERLVPKGEYREAQNIFVSTSDSSDVGAIENIKGNKIPYNNSYIISEITNKTVNGAVNNSASVTLSGADTNIKPGQTVVSKNALDTIPTGTTVSSISTTSLTLSNASTIADGSELSFGSASAEIIGTCPDEKNNRVFFFVTDYSEGQTSIRNMTFPQAHNLCKVMVYNAVDNSINVLVKGKFLNFSKQNIITGSNIIDDLLFFTDNRNQPRKINVAKALANVNHYQHEEQISVSKVSPCLAPFIVTFSSLTNVGTTNITRDKNILSDYMKDKFIRFSYRYKFEDGEYSTIAPFTQIVFEPLNAGVIGNNATVKNTTGSGTATEEPSVAIDKTDIYKRTTVQIMQNRINEVDINVPLPSINEETSATSWNNDIKISSVEILLKESNSPAIKVVKEIQVNKLSTNLYYPVKNTTGGSTYNRFYHKYKYRSEKPFKTLPESQTIRVYDKVPVRAKAQEITGNRVVYGNYTEDYDYPTSANGSKGINFTIGELPKGDREHNSGNIEVGIQQRLEKQYKYHSIKQRRTYQVGVILSDRFGRQSPVLLSTNTDTAEKIKDTFTVEHEGASKASGYSGGHSWSSERAGIIGKSLSVTFEDGELLSDNDIYSTDNPYGWYSWKLVVKQTEQEYHNVYVSHAADSWNNIDNKRDNTQSGRSWISLYGDNINKIPRDIREVDATREGISGSDVRLFPKVIFAAAGASQQQNVNAKELIEVTSLGTAKDQNLYSTDNDSAGVGGFNVFGFVYGKDKNPLIAELPNMKHLGAYDANALENTAGLIGVVSADTTDSNNFILTHDIEDSLPNGNSSNALNGFIVTGANIKLSDGQESNVGNYINGSQTVNIASSHSLKKGDNLFFTNYKEGLSVFETEPFESVLDIYYETTTGGLVKDLNEIMKEAGEGPANIGWDTDNDGLSESTSINMSENTAINGTIGKLGASAHNDNASSTGGNNSGTPALGGSLAWDEISLTDSLGNIVSEKVNVESNGNVKVTQGFAFKNNSEDTYTLRVRAIHNSTSESVANVTINVVNSAPTISNFASTAEVPLNDTGGTVVTSVNVTNGATLSTENTSGLTGVVKFYPHNGTSSFDNYFTVTIVGGVAQVKTTSDFEDNGTAFFNASQQNRRFKITITDLNGSGLSTTSSTHCQVNELQPRTSGLLFFNSSASNICSTSTTNTYYVAKGTQSNDPTTVNGYVQLTAGNKIYITATGADTAAPGYYAFNDGFGNKKYAYAPTSGTVTTIQTCP